MAEWGRKQYSKPWPSRAHVWTWGAFFLSCLLFVFAVWLDGERNWTAAERLYLSDYLKSGARSKLPAAKARYTLLEGVTAKGEQVLVTGDEIEAVKGQDGRYGYVLSDEGTQAGLVRLQWTTGVYNDRGLHGLMGSYVYGNQTLWDFVKRPVLWSVAFFVVLLFVAVPRDRARRMVWKFGRRLRGPELATTAEFNEKLGRKKWFMTYFPDGIALVNLERTWFDSLLRRDRGRWVRVPREREAMHFLIVGAINGTSTASYYGYDGSSDVTTLTNSAGSITDTNEYDVFGNLTYYTGTTPNHFMYRSEEYDSDLSLYYLRARYYNPRSGRFLSRDPHELDPYEPNQIDQFLYAGSDPANNVDPSGRDSVDTVELYSRISAAPMIIRALQATAVAIACADLWIGTKTHAEVAAGAYGDVTMVAPCLWMAKKARGHSDPIPWPGNLSPGPSPHEPDKCEPCPPDSPYWVQVGPPGTHGCPSGIHYHWWHFNQKPYPDCSCYPSRMDGCLPPVGSLPWTPGGPTWP